MNISLDDAAALLVGLDPADPSELREFCQALNGLAMDESYPAACRKPILRAEEAARQLAEGKAADSDAVVARISEQIQKAQARLADPEGPEPAASAPAEPDRPDKGAAPAETGGEAEDAAVEDYMPPDADLELITAFITESSDLITSAEEALLALETDPTDTDSVGIVFRAFHNIKGTSAFFGLGLMTEMAHYAETLLSRIRDQEIRYAGGYPDLALRSVDMLKALFESAQKAVQGQPFLKPNGYDALLELLAEPEAAGITDHNNQDLPPVSQDDISQKYMRGGEADQSEAAPDEPDEPEESEAAPEEPEAAQKSPPTGSPIAPAASGPVERHRILESSVRVPINRLDRFIDMVGELVVAHSMVAQDELVASGKHHGLYKKVTQTSKIVRELQNMSMSMRMIPLKSTFHKMARLVRDLSRRIGKNIVFSAEGEETEIDRNMVDIINDPLVHMVRNAVDHGIEFPQARKKKGKPVQGTLQLAAYHAAGNVVVEVRDDGRGFDRAAILKKAVAMGLVREGASLSERETWNLIFEPGFSTAKNVSDISGRGVGMDVVKKNIEALRGQVEIQSWPDQGSVFKMNLPLTLAIIDGMVVRVGQERYVMPMVSIVRSIQPRPEDLITVLRKGEMLRLQGRLIPIFRLARLFDIPDAVEDPTQAIIMVIEDDGYQVGVLIDELIGSQQIVIKTLGEILRKIPGISGSAIMPNGRVGLILDVGGLVRLANNQTDRR